MQQGRRDAVLVKRGSVTIRTVDNSYDEIRITQVTAEKDGRFTRHLFGVRKRNNSVWAAVV